MNQLSYQIGSSVFSNDHEVRVLIDGDDVLGPDYLGLDPVDFLEFVKPDKVGLMLVGRCDCGCIGCCDVFADVTLADHQVTWKLSGQTYQFEISAYKSTLSAIAFDHSWEDINRRVERILTERIQIDDRWAKDDVHFNWVSTRCSRHQLTYSFTISGEQVTFATGWDSQTEADAIAAHDRLFLKKFTKK
ncbi:hypothetical protein NNA36_12010 [Shimia sp. CNT1-13L.2]|uniref:hypothetical protein n=1 Tax=Shimia sp. CNT1-13L.2 TaxID=2959663 RepID=UPI0020CD3EE7|nr:hypothetical protein [Shimia sp. CNT1-13L.2]MCP9482685.1 hypothetical protein [Shimia sp. CNT1-13L.2]